jgi:hypothetical protein
MRKLIVTEWMTLDGVVQAPRRGPIAPAQRRVITTRPPAVSSTPRRRPTSSKGSASASQL